MWNVMQYVIIYGSAAGIQGHYDQNLLKSNDNYFLCDVLQRFTLICIYLNKSQCV